MNHTMKLSLQIDELLDAFGIEKRRDDSHFNFWHQVKYVLSDDDQRILAKLHQRVLAFSDSWNEEELKMNFISFVLFLADIDEPRSIRTFFERPLSGVIDGYSISVKTDCMIARPKGIGTPQAPYFFLQEFKKSKGDKNDPEGQMLAAMLLAQHLNNDGKRIYGSWLVGSFWHFTILEGKTYYQSQSFDATNYPDLEQIVYILRKLKPLILER